MGALNFMVVVSEALGPCCICTPRCENKDAEPKGRFLSWGQFHRVQQSCVLEEELLPMWIQVLETLIS